MSKLVNQRNLPRVFEQKLHILSWLACAIFELNSHLLTIYVNQTAVIKLGMDFFSNFIHSACKLSVHACLTLAFKY